jgi:hypothetical protein
MLSRLSTSLELLFLTVCLQSKVNAEILLNGSFELPNNNSYAFDQGDVIGEGWIVAPDSVSAAVRFIPGLLGPSPFDGNHYLLFSDGSGGSIQQDFQINIGSSYLLTFYMRHAGTEGASTLIIDLLRNNTSILSTLPAFTAGPNAWEEKQLVFPTLDPGSYRLRFNASPSVPYLDAVTLATAVPEPSAAIHGICALLICWLRFARNTSNREARGP